MRPSTAPGRGWSVLGLALAWAALGTLFGVLNHFEPAGSVAFWFNLVTPLAFSVPGARCWSATGPPTRSAGFSPRWASPRGSRCSSANGNYAIHTNPGSVPGGVLALWLSSVVWFPALGWCRCCSCSFRTARCPRRAGDRSPGSRSLP